MCSAPGKPPACPPQRHVLPSSISERRSLLVRALVVAWRCCSGLAVLGRVPRTHHCCAGGPMKGGSCLPAACLPWRGCCSHLCDCDCLLLLSFQSSLWILGSSPLSGVWSADVHSQLVAHHSILWKVSLVGQNVFILKRSTLIFFFHRSFSVTPEASLPSPGSPGFPPAVF